MPATLPRLSEAVATPAAAMLRKRWLVRAPIWLFRARLGFVFGSMMLMIEHTGRKTGARRYVVLEVIDHPRPGTYILCTAPRSQWYRNVLANPRVRVWAGFRNAAAAIAKPVSSEEMTAILDGYMRQHPRRWAALGPIFEKYLGGTVAGAAAGGAAVMIALELREP